ncbi:SPFH domain-containing protein [Danxiaibacter flavus]|uniref:SPFH domain-containing protein n=1 Tax=Danxiaibacter flavus TaxID=3049108 RepID=A0ABV3ZKP5_9BACT|nr:SPFH domain-containing protein [Chitinophagaceae bacterium DXS]
MISVFFFLLFAGIAIAYALKKTVPAKTGNALLGVRLYKTIGIAVLGLIIAFIQPFVLERVDAGHVGIKVNLTGDNRGVSKFEYKTGWVIYNTWVSKLYEFPTFQQHIDYPEQQVITKGGFSATIKPSFNYALKPGEVGDMFQNLRLDVRSIEQQWLQTAIVGTVNDVANKWAVDDIFNQREKFESDIVTEANHRVSKWFTISQLRTNITPPQALQQSIEAKTKAIQEVQVAENQRLVAIAEGERKVAQARADSAAQVIQAAGEAEAIRRKQVSLSANYIEYMKIQKWDGKLPQVQSGNGGVLLQMPKPE